MIEISQTVQNRLQEANHVTGELLARSRARALAIDKLIVDFLRTAEYANHEIDHTTRKAFRDVRALNVGLRTALRYLFSRHRSDVNRGGPDHPL